MTRIGILSDTHGLLSAQACLALSDCDWVFHAGDICDPGILQELKTIAPVVAVLGNNDFNEYGKRVSYSASPTIDGVSFFMAHLPRDVRRAIGEYKQTAGVAAPQIFIHGHTHVPNLEVLGDSSPLQYLVCPGSVSYPRGGSSRALAKVDIEDEKIVSIRIEDLEGNILMAL